MYCFQGMNDMTNAVKYYKDVLHEANMNVEAIACIATNYFYSDQPEIALKFYRFAPRHTDRCRLISQVSRHIKIC